MNQRYIDLALLVGIGALLIAILILALSAAPMRGAATDNPPNTQPNAEANGAAEPTDQTDQEQGATQGEDTAQDQASEEAAAGVSAVDVTPDENQADAQAEAETTSADTQTSGAEENTEENTEQVTDQTTGQMADQTTDQVAEEPGAETEQPLPTANVTLDRVGFAFITAESGACSIPLQPWRQVAVSRDLLAQYGCGAEITVDLADTVDGKQQVTAQIADTMNPSFERTVNIFVGEEEPALEYGITTGTIEGTAQ